MRKNAHDKGFGQCFFCPKKSKMENTEKYISYSFIFAANTSSMEEETEKNNEKYTNYVPNDIQSNEF